MTKTDYQCIGCGAIIQTDNPNEVGYLPESALQKGIEKGEFYCQRCFRLRHYNELQDLNVDSDIFLDKLSSIAEDDAFIINVVDLFDVEGSLIHGLNRFTNNQPFVVVGNKFDLFPKAVKENRVTHWLTTQFYNNGLYPEDVVLVSANKESTLQPLIRIIERAIHNHNVYIVGVTNVGKSTLINQLIQHYGGDKNIITTSNTPGTTLDLIEIPLTDDHAIIDTPGIIRSNHLAHYLSRDSMANISPTKPIKPRTFQLNADQTIFLAGLARVDFVQGERTAFTYYVSNDLYLHRTKTEKAEDFYKQHVGELLSPPTEEELDSIPELVTQTVHLNPQQDFAISGLGWFTANKEVELKVSIPKGIEYSIRESII